MREIDAVPFVQRNAKQWGEATGHAADPNGVVQHEATSGVGKRKHISINGEAVFERLRVPGTLGWFVVKEDDSLPEDHGAGRPGDHGTIPDHFGKVEEPKPIQQDGDVSARHGKCRHSAQELFDKPSLAPDGVPLAG